MPIIIIAQTPEMQPDPVMQAPVAPAKPIQEPTIKAPLLKPEEPVVPKPTKPSKPVQPIMADPAENAFYGKLNALIDGYKKAKPEDQSNWIDAVSQFQFDAGLSIGDWLASKMPVKTPEDAKSEAQLLIWKALKNVKPDGNLIGWLKKALPNARHTGLSDLSSIESDRFKNALAILRPYLMFLKNIDAPEPGSKPIDEDILMEYEQGKISPGEAANKQSGRDRFNDKVDPATGKTRLQFAREEFEKAVIDTDPKWAQHFKASEKGSAAAAVFRDAKAQLKSANPEYLSRMEDKTSPYWLTAEMYAPRGIGKELMDILWDKVNSAANLSLDSENPETGDTGHDAISTEQFEKFKNRDQGFTKKDKRTIIEEAPYEYLSLFDEDPELQDKIEQRLPQIQPFTPVKDKNGNIVMDGQRMRMRENPEFEKNVSSIVDRLYGPSSAPRKILDDNGRPKGTAMAEKNTKDALHLIGQFYAMSLADDKDENIRIKNLEKDLQPYLREPLVLKHYDGPKLHSTQQYAFALREVMLDIMEYLGNDKNYSELVRQVGSKAAEQLKKQIRTAALLFVSKIIARG